MVCIVEANSKDENYGFLQDNYERLKNARDQNGEKLSIVTLPCPSPIYYEGARLPASYANFYIANEVVLVPVFDDPKDADNDDGESESDHPARTCLARQVRLNPGRSRPRDRHHRQCQTGEDGARPANVGQSERNEGIDTEEPKVQQSHRGDRGR